MKALLRRSFFVADRTEPVRQRGGSRISRGCSLVGCERGVCGGGGRVRRFLWARGGLRVRRPGGRLGRGRRGQAPIGDPPRWGGSPAGRFAVSHSARTTSATAERSTAAALAVRS